MSLLNIHRSDSFLSGLRGHLANFWEAVGKGICLDRHKNLVFKCPHASRSQNCKHCFDAVVIRHSLSTSDKSGLSEVVRQSLVV